MTEARAWISRWGPFIVAIIAVAVAVYLTIAHYTTASALVCSDKGVVNCAKVTTSAQSVIFGIPVALLGLIYFLPVTVLNLPTMWTTMNRNIHVVRIAVAVAGMAFCLYLIYAELFIVGAICLYCTSIHVLTFILFCIVMLRLPQLPPRVTSRHERRRKARKKR